MSSAFFKSLLDLKSSFSSFESLLEKKPWESSIDVNAAFQGDLYGHISLVARKLKKYRVDIESLRESAEILRSSDVNVKIAVEDLNSLDAKVQQYLREFIETCPSPDRRKTLEGVLGSEKQQLLRGADFQDKFVSLQESIDCLLSKDTITLKEIYEHIVEIDTLDQEISKANIDQSRFLSLEGDDTGKENSNIFTIEQQRLNMRLNLSKYKEQLINLFDKELSKVLDSQDIGSNENETRPHTD